MDRDLPADIENVNTGRRLLKEYDLTIRKDGRKFVKRWFDELVVVVVDNGRHEPSQAT
jgi:hypothetical protein